MSFLLRARLPDVPGSLGGLATALGAAGADIQAIEIVEHGVDGTAVDDVLFELPPAVLLDAVVSACQRLDGVQVLWISRYTAGASLRLDLEAVEAMTEDPGRAVERLVELLPQTFRCDWAMVVRARLEQVDTPGGPPTTHAVSAEALAATRSAPDLPDEVSGWFGGTRTRRLSEHPTWEDTVLAATPLADDMVLVFGRRGGPDILGSELARLGHLGALATSIRAAATA